MNSTKSHKFVGAIWANQLGKSTSAAAATALHLTLDYELIPWYRGKKFTKDTVCWVAGKTHETVRDQLQKHIVGTWTEPNDSGRMDLKGDGMIPRDRIIRWTMKGKPSNAIDTLYVRNRLGGISELRFKAYEQGYEKFASAVVDFVNLDEDPVDYRIVSECTARLTRTNGNLLFTMTPTEGLTYPVMQFYPKPISPQYKLVTMTLWECKHLSVHEKIAIWESYPAHERACRCLGKPFQGSGKVFPTDPKYYVKKRHSLSNYFLYGMGIDIGWYNTAAVWIAWDRQNDIVYVFGEYKAQEQEPRVHAADWAQKNKQFFPDGFVPQIAFPHDTEGKESDGESIADQYRSCGMNMMEKCSMYEIEQTDEMGNKRVVRCNRTENGVMEILTRMNSGRLVIFDDLHLILNEIEFYHRKDGKINKKAGNDHLIDALRVALMSKNKFDMALPTNVIRDIFKGRGNTAHMEWDVLGWKAG